MRQGGNRKDQEHSKSLQKRIMIMLVILLLFFCIVFVVTTSMISYKAEEDFKRRTSQTAVNNVVSTIKENLVNYNYISRLIMVNDRVVQFLRAEKAENSLKYDARMAMYETYSMYSYIDSVYVFRKDGEYTSTSRGSYVIDIDKIELTNVVEAYGSTVVSINGNGFMKKSNEKPLLTLSRAIYDINSQKLIGYLVMNIDRDIFDETISLQNSSGMCILDDTGTLLCGSEDIAQMYDRVFINDSIVHKQIRIGGEKKILSGKLAVEPLVVLCVSERGTDAMPKDTIYALMLILIAFIISGMVCAWYITVNIARPIGKLSAAMERTRSSGWLKKIDSSMPNNEIGRLADSYNSMIEYLNELFNRLIEDEKNMQKAEIRVLQEQIKPHFLYNTLETISYLAVLENASKAHDALETLGSFYRNFLSKGDRDIPLKRELRITQDYLTLQKLRYGEIFDDEYQIEEETLDFMMPKLILQPLVENSIYHGVRLKGEKCIIRITTFLDENGLHILVYDSGVGMSKEQIKDVLEQKEQNAVSGFGLSGTINRIRYNSDYNNIVQIRSELGEYTEIEIFIPRMREMGVKEDE